MKGWKTWLAIAALVINAAVDVFGEVPQYEAAIGKVSIALGLFGIGHKVEKAGR